MGLDTAWGCKRGRIDPSSTLAGLPRPERERPGHLLSACRCSGNGNSAARVVSLPACPCDRDPASISQTASQAEFALNSHPTERVLPRTFVNEIIKMRQELGGVWRTVDRRSARRWTAALLLNGGQVIRERSLVPADRQMTGIASFRMSDGSSVKLDSSFSGGREMYCRRVYEPTSDFAVRRGWSVIDLGANQGLFSVMAAVRGAAKVVAVEAQAGFLPEITANAELNGVAHRVVPLVALVGAESGVLASEPAREAASHWEGEAETLDMSEILDRSELSRVDLLKIDIEGSEFALFATADEWLPRVQRIAMEVHTQFGSPSHLMDLVASAGFRTWLADDRRRPVNDLLEPSGYLYAVR